MTTAPRAGAWTTIPEILMRVAAHRPDVVVLSDGTSPDVTAAELGDRARRGAGRLAETGVRRGQYVVVDTTTLSWTEAAIAYFAVTWLGAGAVLTMGGPTIVAARERIGAVAAVTGGDVAEGLVTTGFRELITFTGPVAGPLARPGDDLDVVFTSGSTGTPKPVVSRHSQWTGSVHPYVLTGGRHRTVGHAGVPLGVSGGLHGVLINHLARGVTSVAAPTAADLLERCRTRRVTELHVTPHTARGMVRLMSEPEAWTPDVGTIRVVGGPLPRALADRLFERFPRARVVSIYGLTEGGSALCVRLISRDGSERGVSDSVGRPAAGTQVVALDDQGRALPAGQVGELAMRPHGTTALSYLVDDSLNRDRFTRGWARTGDLGAVDEAGEVHLTGRVKELLFLRAGRLPPEFVEGILARQVPESVDFAVIGLPTPGGWDRIAVLLTGSVDDPAVAGACSNLAAMKGPFRPHVVEVLAEIPRTPNGKPLRRVLADLLDPAVIAPNAGHPQLNDGTV